jgi:hypothetical protein
MLRCADDVRQEPFEPALEGDSFMSNPQRLVPLILKAVALALAVATVVLGVLKALPPENGLTLLGLGLFSLALAALQK